MHICFVNPTVLLRRPIVELAIRCQEKGDRVTIVTPGSPTGDMHRKSDWIIDQYPDIRVERIPSHEIHQVLWSFPTKVTFLADLKRILSNCDLIHIWAPYYPLSFAPLWLKKRNPSSLPPIILTFDTFPGFSFNLDSHWLNRAMRAYTRWARNYFGNAQYITLYSELLQPFARDLELPDSKLHVVPTGIETKHSITLSREAARHKLKVPADRLILLFVGLLNRRKGLDTLLSIAQELETRKVPAHIVIVGSGPGRRKYETMAQNRHITNVDFRGSQPDLSLYYAASDIFVLPSRGEGLPGVVMEAMTYGLPIVASRILCLPDLVQEGENGYLCHPEKPAEFLEAILKLQTREQRQKYSLASRRLIERFDWATIFPRYQELYQQSGKL
jgi:glycosyltransferase involved in cell wall biosynthesis